MVKQPRKVRRFMQIIAVAAAVGLGASGCAAGGGGSDSAGGDRTLNIWSGTQTPVVANFNPFSPSVLSAAFGSIYQPLFYWNPDSTDPATSLLGDSYELSEDGKIITVKLREGVKWSDGEAFTADDVKFSLELDVAKPAGMTSLDVVDDTTVKLTFDEPQFVRVPTILSNYIVPQHLWADIKDPVGFANENPVGTGPYLIDSVSESAYTIKANENYWDKGKPEVKRVRFLAIDNNQSVEDLFKTGKVDWSTMFVPDPTVLTKDDRISRIVTLSTATTLYTCANAALGCTGPQTDVAVRQALDLALDRGLIIEKAVVNQAKLGNPSFLLPGRDDKWLGDGIPAESPKNADPTAAAAILTAAGYSKGNDGIFTKDGKRLEVSLTSVDGWTDYNSVAKLVVEQAAAAGIAINNSTISGSEFSQARNDGKFELMVGGVVNSPVADPWMTYNWSFASGSTAQVGTNVPTSLYNYSRYANPAVDEALKSSAATDDEATKKAAYATIQENIKRDVPYIPIWFGQSSTFVDSKNFTGWPTEDNLYASPLGYGGAAMGIILAELKPVK